MEEEEKVAAAQNQEDKEAALKRLQELKKTIQSHGKWNHNISYTPESLLDELQTVVGQSLSALLHGDYDTVTEVASLASGGLLRKGMVLLPPRGAHSGSGGGHDAGAKQADGVIDAHQDTGTFKPAPLSAFGEPVYLATFSASTQTPPRAKVVSTTSMTAFKHFENSIQTHGLNYAASVHCGGFGGWGEVKGYVSGEKKKEKQHDKREDGRGEVETACMAMCDEVPMCSFEPATSAMTFTEDAVRALGDIGGNHIKALKFMEKYGEVVPMGTHTLGGVRIFKMTLEKTSAEGSALTSDVVNKEWNFSIGAAAFLVGAGGGTAVAVKDRDQNALNKGIAQEAKTFRRTVDTVCIGPQAINRSTFWNALTSSNKTWRVIARDLSFNTLVPIWEVVEHSRVAESLRDPVQVAQFLRSSWCNRALRVIDGGNPLLLEEHKPLVIQLFNSESNSPLAVPTGSEGNSASMDWVPAVLQAVRVQVDEGLTAAGEDVAIAHRSALVDAFRIVRIRAPKECQAMQQLHYLPFHERVFCNFVEMLLASQSSGGEMVLRARLSRPEVIQEIMRILRDHASDSDPAVCFPDLTAFLGRMQAGKHEDVEESSTVSVLDADFPDAISIHDACKWLETLSARNDKISDSSRSSDACQILGAALAALTSVWANLVLDEQKARMCTHLDHYNRICRDYHFTRDYFPSDKEPSAGDLRRMAIELRENLLREFKEGEIVKKSFSAPRWEGSIDSQATLYGYVIGHDNAQTAHVLVKWSLIKGVDVYEIKGEEAKHILVEHWKEAEEDVNESSRNEWNGLVRYEHVSDLTRDSQFPSPSLQLRNNTVNSGLANVSLLQSDPFFTRLGLCADRNSERTSSEPLRYVDILRWRLPDVAPATAVKKNVKKPRRRNKAPGRSRAGASSNSIVSEASGLSSLPVMDLYADLENAEEVDKVLICAALLDQRRAVPLFWKRQATSTNSMAVQVAVVGEELASSSVRAVDIVPVVAFLRARLEIPRNTVDLYTDEKLPRVVFYEPNSDTGSSTVRMANDILHTHFRRNTPTDLLVSLEMSIGFVDQQQGGEASFAPCLVFLVRGDAHLLPKYLADAFHAGVLLVSSGSVTSSLQKLPDFFTRSEAAYCFNLEPSAERPENWYGPCEEVTYETLLEDLQGFVNDVLEIWRDEKCQWRSMRNLFSILQVSQEKKATSSDISGEEMMGEAAPVTQTALFACATEDPFRELKIPARNVRSSMKLQDLFREEARIEDDERLRYRLRAIRNVDRKHAAVRVLKHPVMVAFMETLQSSTRTQRLLRLQRLDNALAEASQRNESVLRAQQQIDHIDRESRRVNISDVEMYGLKQERRKQVSVRYNNSIDLACLSRELGHLYSALFNTIDQEHVEHLPELAAQLLLDGGTVEFMDGDAAKVNEFWVSSVLIELNLKLNAIHGGRDVRVSVRSVFGMQSCGKSTVLNCMYGCRLPTSAGVCTRGINMFIVPCERPNSPYQAILGLDTEGICSPEQERQEASETSFINNRMALFCVLLADAGLCISTTESNDIFRETLGIVMAVYHGSDIAAQQGSMRTRLFFLYNRSSSVDEVNGVRMKLEQDRVFTEVLKEAWKMASNQRGGTKEWSKVAPPAFLEYLNQDKDIERVQQLNQAPRAPNDVPDPDFGRKLAKFSDHIHSSIAHSRGGTSLSEFIQRFKDVNEAVHWGKNYLLYPDIMRYRQKLRESAAFETCVHEAAKLTYDAFIGLQSEMVSKYESGNTEDRHAMIAEGASKDWDSTPWPSRTRRAVYDVFNATLEDMRQALQMVTGDSFDVKIAEYERLWDEKAKVDSDTRQRAMRMKWTAVTGIAPRLKAFQKRIYERLFEAANNELKRTAFTKLSERDTARLFDEVFDSELRKAQKQHPNVHVKNCLLKLAESELQPALTFGKGNRSRKSYENNVIFSTRPRDLHFKGTFLRQTWGLMTPQRLSEMDECVVGIFEEAERTSKSAPDEFVNHIAYEILDAVDKRIEDWNRQHVSRPFSDSDRTEIRMHIIARIGNILQYKQDRHHSRHGLAARFEAQKENMSSYFDIMLRGRKGLDALAEMLRVELKRCVRASPNAYAVKEARLLLDSEPWLRSVEGSLALVDYEILQHFKKGDKVEALRRARDPNCFVETIAERIVGSLNAEKIHRDMVHDLKNSLLLAKDACIKAARDVSPWRSALDELNTRATAKNLTIDISASADILDKTPSMTEDLEQTAEKFFDKLIDWLTQLKVKYSALKGEDLYRSMAADMPTEGALQARCGAGCPRCRMPCMKERGHNVRYSGDQKLHSCTHQPNGLCGGSWRKSKCLMWESCVQNTKNQNVMLRRVEDSKMPYTRFREWYPEWEQPPETQRSRPVREFLFYNCQSELVDKYPGTRECSTLDKSDYSRHALNDLLRSAASTAFGRDIPSLQDIPSRAVDIPVSPLACEASDVKGLFKKGFLKKSKRKR